MVTEKKKVGNEESLRSLHPQDVVRISKTDLQVSANYAGSFMIPRTLETNTDNPKFWSWLLRSLDKT